MQEAITRLLLYRELKSRREEILRHKWIESERAGVDIGFDRALVDWAIFHQHDWMAGRSDRLNRIKLED